MCPEGLDDRFRVRGLAVELLPDRRLSPRRAVVAPGAGRVELVQQVDVLVGGHRPQHLRRRQRALRVHAAPPEDGLDPPDQAHAPVVPQHGPQLRVDAALDPVVGPRQRPLPCELRVQVGEQHALAHQGVEPAPGRPEARVGVLPPAVHHRPLLEEVAPEGVPLHVALDPPLGLAEVLDAHELLRQAVELDARLQPRPGSRLPLDLAERVEQAPLHPRPRPFLRHRRREPGAAVGDDDGGRRDARQQRPPGPDALGAGEVPRQHVVVAAGDQHDDVAGEVDAVDVDDAVDLAVGLRHRPYPPELGGEPPEGSALPGHVQLASLPQQPAEERLELPGGGVVGVGRACAARLAPPSLSTRARLPVALHGLPAGGAFLVLHRDSRARMTFLRDSF